MKPEALGAIVVAVVAVVATYAAGARAQPASPPPDEDSTEDAPPPPPPPTTTPPPPTPTPAAGGPSPMALRLALVGASRRLDDLSVLAAGVDVSVGCACDRAGGSVDFRMTSGRTPGGLSITEIELGGAAELKVTGGLFLGLGGGLTAFGVRRATNGGEILSVGPELFGRVGYRLGTTMAPYVTLDLGSQLQSSGTFVWGPTLAVGYRF